jgi:DNA invertase Pin-like site-specific DNA recombinase
MGKKPMTVTEMARMGGRARARKYGKVKLRAFASNAGRRPYKLVGNTVRRLGAMLAAGKSHAEISKRLGLSLRTIGRVVARQKQRAPSRKEGV